MDFRFRRKSGRVADIIAMAERDLYIGRLVACRPTGCVDILRRRKALRLSIGGPHRRLFIWILRGARLVRMGVYLIVVEILALLPFVPFY
jgi:hypothetical protein